MDNMTTLSSPIPSESIMGTTSMSNYLAILAVALSFFALIVTIYSNIKTYSQASKINNININSNYYKMIFDEYIVNEIPKKRIHLSFQPNGKLSTTPMLDFHLLMVDMLNGIHFFSFQNKKFYNDLKSIIIHLDDYIASSSNVTMDNVDRKQVFFDEVDTLIQKLYTKIFETYLNGTK